MKIKLYMKMILVIGSQEKTSVVFNQLQELGIQRTAIIKMIGVVISHVLIVTNKNSVSKIIVAGGNFGTTEICADKISKLSFTKPTIYFLNDEGKSLKSEKVKIVSFVEEIFKKESKVATV